MPILAPDDHNEVAVGAVQADGRRDLILIFSVSLKCGKDGERLGQ